jgi:serine/threonine-protein kinase
VLDFGIAKAVGRLQNTREGQMKGKLSYLAPEQFLGGQVDRRADLFAASIVLWEALTGERLFHATLQNEVVARILSGKIQPPSELNEALGPEIDALVLRGLHTDPSGRFSTAREMAIAIEQTIGCAPQHEVGELVLTLLGDSLGARALQVQEVETDGVSLARSQENERATLPAPPAPARLAPPAPALPPATGEDARLVAATIATRAVSTGLSVKGRMIALVLAALASGAVGIALAIGGQSRAVEPSSAGSAAASSAGAAAPPPVASLAAPVASGSLPVASALASVTGAAPTSPPVRHPGRVSSPKSPRCNPPYTVDARGIKYPKMDCL